MSLTKQRAAEAAMAAPGIKAIIFDCFGVLYLDSKQSLLSVVSGVKRQELADLLMSNNYGYFSRQEYLDQVADITGLTPAEVVSYIAKEHHLNAELVALIRDTIKSEYKVGMLSNIGREWIEDFFSRHELHSLFDETVLSGEEGMTKPHPAIFELTASRLGVDVSECLMIDDIAENCEGAEIAGMQAIHFVSNKQLLDEMYRLKVL